MTKDIQDRTWASFPKEVRKDKRYLRMAFIWAENSYAVRLKVGCLIVKDGVIISDGYNGTPSGFANVCEYAVSPNGKERAYPQSVKELRDYRKKSWNLVTKDCVLHAESNAITKLAKKGNAAMGATIYVTDEPCLECAKLIIQTGIARVVYARSYRLHDGITLLKEAGVTVDFIPTSELEKDSE